MDPSNEQNSPRMSTKVPNRNSTYVNSDTFSSRAKQNAKMKNQNNNLKSNFITEKNITVKRNGMQTRKDLQPKTPMNNLQRVKKLNAHFVQQNPKKGEACSSVKPNNRILGKSTITNLYNNQMINPNSNLIDTSVISEDSKSQSEDSLLRIKALFKLFRKNHDNIVGNINTSGKKFFKNLDLPKVKEEPLENCPKNEDDEERNKIDLPKVTVKKPNCNHLLA